MTAVSPAPERPFETRQFRAAFAELLAWRRDVRSFRTDPVDEALVLHLLRAAALAPSVGLSQPWRFVRVRDAGRRGGVRESFRRCNTDALAGYEGGDAKLYAELKLAGLDEAPEHLAVFSDQATATGRGLGRRTMPQTLDYSVVAAVQTLWLAARTLGLGLGWVSILDPGAVVALLEVPSDWKLIAYLCLGYPQDSSVTPELQRLGWERKRDLDDFVFDR
jgi:5,6-dimethylbenzimidazole synthase